MYIYKGKVVAAQAWTGPEGSRRLMIPNFKAAHEVGKVSPAHRPPLLPRNIFMMLIYV